MLGLLALPFGGAVVEGDGWVAAVVEVDICSGWSTVGSCDNDQSLKRKREFHETKQQGAREDQGVAKVIVSRPMDRDSD